MVIQGSTIIILIASANPAVEKLLTALTKVPLVENGQNVNVSKIWI